MSQCCSSTADGGVQVPPSAAREQPGAKASQLGLKLAGGPASTHTSEGRFFLAAVVSTGEHLTPTVPPSEGRDAAAPADGVLM